MTVLPPELLSAVKEQRAVLFLGAGASLGALSANNVAPPMGDKLRDKLCDKFLGGALKHKSLLAVSALAENEASFLDVQRFIHDLYLPYQPADFHKLIPTFRWAAIATTNFDLIVERAYDGARDRLQNYVKTVKDGDGLDLRISQTQDPVSFLKLHGCIEHYTDKDIPLILGQEQYAEYAKNRRRMYDRLRGLCQDFPVIFCGYSITDPHIQQLIFDLSDLKVKRHMFYHVAPDTDDIEARYLSKHRITCIKATLATFLTELDRTITPVQRSLSVAVGGGQLSTRKHYAIANVDESQVLRSYIDRDVLHIHSGLSVEAQSQIEFYKGYDRGWGCITQNLDARREICDSVLVDAVLTEEARRKPVEFFILKGPAGNGKTVALKRIAWDAATEYDQLILWVTGPSSFRTEPFSELSLVTQKRIFLFVDRIALFREHLRKFLDHCVANRVLVTVIGTERDNEWNVYCEDLEPRVTQEFSVPYLAEGEIRELLGLLERHKALGLLAEVPLQERVDAFTKRAGSQLLVALHETTLGTPFEKIVLDEYTRVEPSEARAVYLDICTLHQFGAPVRAGLISRSTGISFEDFNNAFLKSLEEVVLVETDRHSRDNFYRSRHQHVAELVFNQVLPSSEERYDVLVRLIQAMNIDYSSDKETFSRLVKGRSVAQIFTNVEIGRLFFDVAEGTAPTDYFIPHQRAVFELNHKSGRLDLAEAAAARAHDLSPNNRSVRNTQAEVSRRQAGATSNPLKKQVLRRSAREKLSDVSSRLSDYDLNTRARLALDELKEHIEEAQIEPNKVSDESRILEAAKEAQTSIQLGLSAYPDSAELLATEAELHTLLNKKALARQSLERAFRANARQDWLAIKLARLHCNEQNQAAATQVLEQCLKQNPGSKLAHLELALILIRAGNKSSQIVDHLKQSFTAGDSHFEGQFWYARELTLAGNGDEAEKLFDSIHARAPARFRPTATAVVETAPGIPRIVVGVILRKEEGYAFARCNDFSNNIFASRTDSDEAEWKAIKAGTKVACHLAFSRRGPRLVRMSRSVS